MKFSQKLNEIIVKIGILKKSPFSMIEHKKTRAHGETHIQKKQGHGETLNKQYNHGFL